MSLIQVRRAFICKPTSFKHNFLCHPVVTSSNQLIPQYEADELLAFNSALEAYVRLLSAATQLFPAEK